jgi:hypothetical protein
MQTESAGFDPPTFWTLVQTGTEVTGTSRRIAPFVTSDTGTLTGTATGDNVTLTWVNTVELSNPSGCNPSTTQTTATMVVTGESMTGRLVTRLPACRSFAAPRYTFRRAKLPSRWPTPIDLVVAYQQGPAAAYQLSTGCTHHYGPLHGWVQMDGLPVDVRLSAAGERLWTARIAGAWPGEHWIAIADIGLCPSNDTSDIGPGPYATSGVSVNGVPVTRVIQGRLALAFNLSEDGTVR